MIGIGFELAPRRQPPRRRGQVDAHLAIAGA